MRRIAGKSMEPSDRRRIVRLRVVRKDGVLVKRWEVRAMRAETS